MNEQKTDSYEGFAILELMGHRRLAGKVSQGVIGGSPLIRIDIPDATGKETTQFYSPASLYCLTPTTEEIVKRMAQHNYPAPVNAYELALPEPRTETLSEDDEDVNELGVIDSYD